MAFTADDVNPLTQAQADLPDPAGNGHVDLLLVNDAVKGLEDVAAGRVSDAQSTLAAIKRRRAVTARA